MPVSISDSFVAEKALDYSKLCDLSYAKWKWSSGQWVLDTEKRWGQVLYFNILNDIRCSWLDLYA